MRPIRLGFALLTAVLLTACALDNPTDRVLPDAGPCGTMGAACCPPADAGPGAARTICRGDGLLCSAGNCVACGAPGQPCCAPTTGGGMDAGAGGTCAGSGVACLASMCVDCSGTDRAICNGQCVSLLSDTNCGACANACVTSSGERCVSRSASAVDGGVTDAGSLPDGGARVAFCQIQCPPGQPTLCGATCRDLTTDPNNCSACGRQCMLPNAVSGCMASACTLGACNAGFGNCDGNNANGCEVATTTDVMNCGVCGQRCSFANAAATCAAGICQLGACMPGFANCDGNAANGCETNTAMGNIANCGGCGMACPTPGPGASAVCSGSTCRISTVVCGVGEANCDGNDANGCEVRTLANTLNCGPGSGNGMAAGCGVICNSTNGTAGCAGGACNIMCMANFRDCDANLATGCEVDIRSSVNNCGMCGRACSSLPNVLSASVGCVSGACTLGGGTASCAAGFGNCDSNAMNGCETNTNVDGGNCGACGRMCLLGQTCQAGVCTTVCATGTNPCTASGTTTCRDLATDNNNCGTCGRACAAGQVCTGGSCQVTCGAGITTCPAVGAVPAYCANTQTDRANCGTCGNACAAGQICMGAVCTASCFAGQNPCTVSGVTTCRDFQTDNSNCGMCGRACTGGQTCQAGACACPTGQQACSGICRATLTDNNNCGLLTNAAACGNVCASGNLCVAGVCTPNCATGQTPCSGICRDTSSDRNNCGTGAAGCGVVCAAGQTCSGGTCICPAGQTACTVSGVTTCRATQTDNSNCGTCGTVCGGGQVCSAGVCTATCASPTINCSGVCRDIANDPNNCGTNPSACGRVCASTNGIAGCASGSCTLAACNSGFGNCDGNNSNGCEVNTNTTTTNCGVCGNSCQFANAAATCVAGRCTMGACATGFRDCDGSSVNGCEVNVVAGDINNCGACTTRCPTPPVGSIAVCAASTCGTSSVSCAAGFADCNGMPGDANNGCEVNITTTTNCGACGRACVGTNGTANCTSGLCGITCSTGFGNCNGLLSDGCETDTRISAANCGGCNTLCSLANATAGCASSACTIASCNAGFANCDGMTSNGCERNLNSDNANCGACGTICGSGTVCSAGVCVSSCGSGQTNCTGTCRDLTSDPDACGACATVCSGTGLSSRTCGASACNGTCSAGRANCDGNLQSNGCEVDTNTSITQCGACTGAACSTSNIATACSGGNCTGTCNVGFADCDANKRTNGCEINTTNDVANCGGCSTACPARANATTTCASSTCGFTCNMNFANCDAMAATGCEVNTTNDVNNCSACSMVCPTRANATRTCTSSTCGFTCNAGFGNCDAMAATGCEADLTDEANCGACGVVCSGATPTCVNMSGTYSCGP